MAIGHSAIVKRRATTTVKSYEFSALFAAKSSAASAADASESSVEATMDSGDEPTATTPPPQTNVLLLAGTSPVPVATFTGTALYSGVYKALSTLCPPPDSNQPLNASASRSHTKEQG